jgi:hypothetical protein
MIAVGASAFTYFHKRYYILNLQLKRVTVNLQYNISVTAVAASGFTYFHKRYYTVNLQ